MQSCSREARARAGLEQIRADSEDAVVRLLRFIRRKRPQISFSRRNLFARDAGTCQYCGGKRESSDLTYDHVVPRSLGGHTDWQNIITIFDQDGFTGPGFSRQQIQAGSKLHGHVVDNRVVLETKFNKHGWAKTNFFRKGSDCTIFGSWDATNGYTGTIPGLREI